MIELSSAMPTCVAEEAELQESIFRDEAGTGDAAGVGGWLPKHGVDDFEMTNEALKQKLFARGFLREPSSASSS